MVDELVTVSYMIIYPIPDYSKFITYYISSSPGTATVGSAVGPRLKYTGDSDDMRFCFLSKLG